MALATLRLLDVEVFKLRQRRMTWLLLAILLGLIVIVYLLLWAVTETLTEQATTPTQGNGLFTPPSLSDVRDAIFLQQAVPFGLQITQGAGTFLSVILASSLIGAEYGWTTIRPYLTAVPTRWQYLASKLAALVVLIVLGTAAGMATALVTSSLITFIGGDPDFGFIDGPYILESLASYGRTLLAMSPYIAMAVFFATLGRSTMGGIGSSLGVLILEAIVTSLMVLAGGFAADLTNLFPGPNADTLMLANNLELALRQEQQAQVEVPRLEAWGAGLVLAGYTVTFIAGTFVLFQRRDIHA